ncbi:MAG: CBS domain-containing protein [Clostridia bacterium]|nr:CBS domain-containing protein [Clostridia bacterium]
MINIMRFLTPKSNVAFLDSAATVRNGFEKMTFHKYRAIPVISSDGVYVGTITEGDLLRSMLNNGGNDMREHEKVFIKDIVRDGWNPPVSITCTVDQLFHRVAEQNFVPVVDDRGVFIGLVTRKAVITYLAEEYEKSKANNSQDEK